MATDKRIDDQKPPVDETLVRWEVGPTFFTATSHDPSAVGQYINGLMNSSGHWTIKAHDSDGNVNEAVHNHHKTSAQSKTGDLVGHEDHRRGGGSRESSKQGAHTETGDSHTHAVDGPQIQAASAGSHNHGVGGHGKHHMEGDQNFSVEDGILAFESSKGFSVHSNETVHLGSDQQISQDAGTNWAMTAQANSSMFTVGPASITSSEKITLQVGQSSIIIDQNSITLQVGSKGIKIDSSGVSITKTVYLGDSSPGSHDADKKAYYDTGVDSSSADSGNSTDSIKIKP